MNIRSGLLITLWVAIAVVVHKEVTKENRMPRPEFFIYIAIIWAVLGGLAEIGLYELAVVFGAGLNIAMIYTYILNGQPALTGKTAGEPGNTAKRREDPEGNTAQRRA